MDVALTDLSKVLTTALLPEGTTAKELDTSLAPSLPEGPVHALGEARNGRISLHWIGASLVHENLQDVMDQPQPGEVDLGAGLVVGVQSLVVRETRPFKRGKPSYELAVRWRVRHGSRLAFGYDLAALLGGWGLEAPVLSAAGDIDVHELVMDCARAWRGPDAAQTLLPVVARARDEEALNEQVLMLGHHPLELATYHRVYRVLADVLPTDQLSRLCDHNAYLRLSHSLAMLDEGRDQVFATPDATMDSVPDFYSAQQMAAIATAHAFVLVQAGAGCGKSSVVTGRIGHLVSDCGIAPGRIVVTSFTNKAAEHLAERLPGITSVTTATMVHQIYQHNHPTHQLSNLVTLSNSLRIAFPRDTLARRLRLLLEALDGGSHQQMTDLQLFVAANGPGVLALLDTLRQTTLELEMAIACEFISTMDEPEQFHCDFMMVDEVQDNSVLEFCFAIAHALKHRHQLFMVGDPSQTLYEFRGSNPKALNLLEVCGVFETLQLTTNYRSVQPVLSLANQVLDHVQANEHARIQLTSHRDASMDRFEEVVRTAYRKMGVTAFDEQLPQIIAEEAQDWFAERVGSGAQVAMLAPNRKQVVRMERFVRDCFPLASVANLVPTKSFDSNVLSSFMRTHGNDVRQASPVNAAFVLRSEVHKNLATLVRNPDAARPAIDTMFSTWWAHNGAAVQHQVARHLRGEIDREEFFGFLESNLIDFEISQHSITTAMDRGDEVDFSGADVVLSTIHSAKGLEFPHVFVLHTSSNDKDQADLRRDYVALTRAMDSEFVLSRGDRVNSEIDRLVAGALASAVRS